MIAVVAVATVVASAPYPSGNPTAPPIAWAELQKTLPAEKTKKAQVLTRFAKDDDASLADRQSAARELLSTLAPGDAKRIDADLIDAHLAFLAKKPSKRKEALWRAVADAKRAQYTDKAALIERSIAAEEAVLKLARKASADPALAAAVEQALPMWLSLGDELLHGVARIALAKQTALTDADAAVRALSDVVDALGNGRDSAPTRVEAWRLMAKLLATTSVSEAAAASIAADHVAMIDPKASAATAMATAATTVPATAAPATPHATSYARTKETMALCTKAREQGVDCAKIELKRWGTRTFYDFSKEKTGAFDQARATAVLREYESLLQDCLATGAKANLTTNTHVELVWSVGNDGRVLKKYDLKPYRLIKTVVDACLGDAFAAFRYPTYRGEMQHVVLTYDVGE